MRQTIAAAVVALILIGSAVADDQHIEALVKQLGAAKSADRRAAKEELEKLGYAARKVLLQYRDTKDPEVRASVLELLKTLRWQLMPGAEKQVRQLFTVLEEGEDGQDLWDNLAKEYPTHILNLIMEVNRTPGINQKVHFGVYSFLGSADPIEAAEFIREMPEDEEKELIKLLDRVSIDFSERKREQTLLFYCLNDYRRTAQRARDYWLRSTDELALKLAAISVVEGELEPEFWEDGGQTIYRELSAQKRCRKMSFYVGVAKQLRKVHVARGFISVDPLKNTSPTDLYTLIQQLQELGLEDEVDSLLNGRADPWLKFMVLHRLNKEMEMPMTDQDWKKILDSAKTDQQIMRLANNLQGLNPTYARKALEHIIATEPEGTSYDMDAHFQLAWMAQSVGNYSRGAEELDKFVELRIRAAQGRVSSYVNSLKQQSKELVALAKHQNAEYVELMRNGRKLEVEGRLAEATEKYRQAVKLTPTLPIGHQALATVLRDQERYAEYNEAIEKMLEVDPGTTRNYLTWCFRASDILELDKALKYLEHYVKDSPSGFNNGFAKAMVLERKGELDNALVELKAMTQSRRYANVYRQLALVYLKQGKNKEADESLTRHLLYNPFDEYSRIWQFIARKRLGLDDRHAVKRFIANRALSVDAWSTKILQHCIGTVSAQELIAFAEKTEDEHIRKSRLCEGYFYLGQLAEADKETDKAKEYLKKTIEFNITLFIEHIWALNDLPKLK